MKTKHIPAIVALAIGAMLSGCTRDDPAAPATDAVAGAQVAAAEAEALGADHAHAAAQAAGRDFPLPDNHVPWTPDAPLIEGMSRVRSAIGALQAQRDEATVLARADEVDAAIEYMFENCRLDTEPDVALHAILARLMAATQALRANPADTTPVHDMHAAVENYERLFDDPSSNLTGSL